MRYLDKDGTAVAGAFVGLDGRPVARPPWEYHYSYDEYVLYKSRSYRPTDGTEWSDRLMQRDYARFRAAVAETWPDEPESQSFNRKKPRDVERFLSLYEGRPVELTALLQGCDHASGNPYWVFIFRDAEGTPGPAPEAGE